MLGDFRNAQVFISLLLHEKAHIRDLEEQRARSQPVVSLVDNMVKLGSLYRGPQDAPLSHRIRNLPSKSPQNADTGGGHCGLQEKPQPGILQEEAETLAQQTRADIQVIEF